MHTMSELLNPDLINQRIADRHADAVAWRRAREASAASRQAPTWSLSAILRIPVLRHGSQVSKAI